MSTPHPAGAPASTPLPFLTIEGVDGAGKSSHLSRICTLLNNLGHDVVLTREPGGTPLGERLRDLSLSTEMQPMTEVLLMMAGRHEHESEVIWPALSHGRTVVSDRFKDSTFAFQGAGRGLPQQTLRTLDAATSSLQPLRTILFDIDPAVARQRMSSKELDRFERMGALFHRRVRAAYLERTREEPERFLVIDAGQSIEQVGHAVRVAVETFHAHCLTLQDQFPQRLDGLRPIPLDGPGSTLQAG